MSIGLLANFMALVGFSPFWATGGGKLGATIRVGVLATAPFPVVPVVCIYVLASGRERLTQLQV